MKAKDFEGRSAQVVLNILLTPFALVFYFIGAIALALFFIISFPIESVIDMWKEETSIE